MAIHWTQTPKGKALLAQRRSLKRSQPEDRLPLLYALPGIEMAATMLIERINSIRSLLNQPPWSPPLSVRPTQLRQPVQLSEPEPIQPTVRKRRVLSPQARKSIARAQRLRWQRVHAAKKAAEKAPEPEPEPEAVRPKRKLSVKQLKAIRQNAIKARAALKAKVKAQKEAKNAAD